MNIDKLIQDLLAKQEEKAKVRLGTIPADYVSGSPRVIGDGEAEPSTKVYPVIQSYTPGTPPAPGDRVMMQRQGQGWVVAGKIGDLGPQPPPPAPATGSFEQIYPDPIDTWVATHNLGATPQVFTYDAEGRQVQGNVEVNNATDTRVTFFFPVSGRMVLSL